MLAAPNIMLRLAAFVLGALAAVASVAVSRAQAQEMFLPVPAVTIQPNDEITDDLIIDRAFITATVTRGAVQEDRRFVIGKVAKRPLLKGLPIPVNALRDPYVVISGKPAIIVFEEGGLSITGQATALQSGSIGDIVSLRNGDSGAVIRGVIAKDGTVRVGTP